MAICTDCEQDMLTARSCTIADVMLVDGQSLPRVWHSNEHGNLPCGDCGVDVGGFHHLGCDIEECPRCHGQLISCGCWSDGEEEDEQAQ